MSRDRDRSRAYQAEDRAFESTLAATVLPIATLAAIARRVCDLDWWSQTAVADRVEVRAARSDAASSSFSAVTNQIRLAGIQATPATLVHELAHAHAGVDDGHGPKWRGSYVVLSRLCFGRGPADALAAEFAAADLTTVEVVTVPDVAVPFAVHPVAEHRLKRRHDSARYDRPDRSADRSADRSDRLAHLRIAGAVPLGPGGDVEVPG